MKEVKLKILSELIRNSRSSDREIAKKVDTSQPTVTRMRRRLEKEGYIKEFTVIPDFSKLGYHLLALTFAKTRSSVDVKDLRTIGRTAKEVFQKTAPLEILFCGRGTGLGYQGVFISLHKDYTSYLEFRDWLVRFSANAMNFMDISAIDGFFISLDENVHYRKLTFSTLAKHLLATKETKE